MENTEKGTRQLSDMIGDLFDSSGNYKTTVFQLRELSTNAGIYQYRIGQGTSYDTGWVQWNTNDLSDIADLASNSATAAANSATAAAASATSASASETVATAAQTQINSFTQIFLGPFASNPSGSFAAGTLYFNTTDNALRVYNGTSWQTAVFDASGALVAANNLSDLANAATALSNLDSNLASFVSAFTLPTADDSAGKVLKTDGAGTLSFGSVSSGGGTSKFSVADSAANPLVVDGEYEAIENNYTVPANGAQVFPFKTLHVTEVASIAGTSSTFAVTENVNNHVFYQSAHVADGITITLTSGSIVQGVDTAPAAGTSTDLVRSSGEMLYFGSIR
tara:strand:- start:833 stop:1843 length:1011 start_codon:yes stop_codon:yes gene_type:complete